MTTAPALVSTGWLDGMLSLGGIVPVDARWYLDPARDAASEYLAGHLPGAVRFDIDVIADKTSPKPHAVPSAAHFAACVGAMGIDNDTHVVAYDSLGGASAAARAWWLFRLFGHDNVSVLDGGYPKWIAEGRHVEAGTVSPSPARFEPRLRPDLLSDRDGIRAAIDHPETRIVDVRSPGRFTGETPEPRPGLSSGHIPSSRNLHYATLIDGERGTILGGAALAERFAAAGVDPARPVVFSCGSGVTACLGALALKVLNGRDAAVYDGSWADWGSDPALPVEKGAA